MSLAFPHRENFMAKEDRLVVSGAACPGTAGDPLLVSRFLPTRESRNNSIILHRTTSAKTRATVRQMAEQPTHYSSTHLKVSGLMSSLFCLQAKEVGSAERYA
jgi:hypothetical protein